MENKEIISRELWLLLWEEGILEYVFDAKVRQGNLEAVRLLIEAGVDLIDFHHHPDYPREKKYWYDEEIIRLLNDLHYFTFECNFNQKLVNRALNTDYLTPKKEDASKKLSKSNIISDELRFLLYETNELEEMLCRKAEIGDLEAVKLLIEAGTNLQHEFGVYAIECAAKRGDLELLNMLFEAGTPVSVSTFNAIKMASENGNQQIAEILKERVSQS